MITCPDCKNRFEAERVAATDEAVCPFCHAVWQTMLFPAVFRETATGRIGERLADDSQASCFQHPDRKAVVLCERCGRFLCTLCDLPVGEHHLCPQCLEPFQTEQRDDKEIPGTETIVLYDSIALSLAILPLLMFYLTFLTAPVVLYMVVRYWNSPRGPMPRSRIRFILAAAAALMQVAGWLTLAGYLLLRFLE